MLGIMLIFAALTRITLYMNNIQANLYNPFYGEELYTLYKERFGHTPMFTEPGQLRESSTTTLCGVATIRSNPWIT